MAGINLVVVQGNLGQDPELRHTQSGEPVATLSVATSEQWTKDGEKHEKTEWHRIIVWGKMAENCAKYLAKGHKCSVVGRLETRKWQDKQGVDRYTTEIVAKEVQFLGASTGNSARAPHPADSAGAPARGSQSSQQMYDDRAPNYSDSGSAALDDIPF